MGSVAVGLVAVSSAVEALGLVAVTVCWVFVSHHWSFLAIVGPYWPSLAWVGPINSNI